MEVEELAKSIQSFLLRADHALTESEIQRSYDALEGSGSLHEHLSSTKLTLSEILQLYPEFFVKAGTRWRSAATSFFNTVLNAANDPRKTGRPARGRGCPAARRGAPRGRGSPFLSAPRGGNRGGYGAAFRSQPSGEGITSRGGGNNGFGRRPCPPLKTLVQYDNNQNWDPMETDNDRNYSLPSHEKQKRRESPPRRIPDLQHQRRRTPSPFSQPPPSPSISRRAAYISPTRRGRTPSPESDGSSRRRVFSPKHYRYPYRDYNNNQPRKIDNKCYYSDSSQVPSSSPQRFNKERCVTRNEDQSVLDLADRFGAQTVESRNRNVQEVFRPPLDRSNRFSGRREVEITRFRNFTTFSVRFIDEFRSFLRMDEKIQKRVNNQEPVLPIEVWRIRQACLYRDSTKWNRAVVQKIEGNMLRLLLIDIGMTVMTDPTKVIPMPSEFSQIPPYAFQCTLAADWEQLEEIELEVNGWAKSLNKNRFRPCYISRNTDFDRIRDGVRTLGVDLFITILDKPKNILDCRI